MVSQSSCYTKKQQSCFTVLVHRSDFLTVKSQRFWRVKKSRSTSKICKDVRLLFKALNFYWLIWVDWLAIQQKINQQQIWLLFWKPYEDLGWRNGWSSVCVLHNRSSMWHWWSLSVPVGSLPQSPCHCTGCRWLLAPHFHGMPAEGKCVHLPSFVCSLTPNPQWIILLSVYQAKGHWTFASGRWSRGVPLWTITACTVCDSEERKRREQIREKSSLFAS